ncbi:hypothetical protein V2G26_008122 [Clonostachys chloroleuca]
MPKWAMVRLRFFWNSISSPVGFSPVVRNTGTWQKKVRSQLCLMAMARLSFLRARPKQTIQREDAAKVSAKPNKAFQRERPECLLRPGKSLLSLLPTEGSIVPLLAPEISQLCFQPSVSIDLMLGIIRNEN